MIALSVQEPWATRILREGKTIETRTWETKYRGDLVICASKRPESPNAGKALCIVRLVECRPMVPADEAAAQCWCEPGDWAWVLADLRPFARPFVQKGALGLFVVRDDLVRAALQPATIDAGDAGEGTS